MGQASIGPLAIGFRKKTTVIAMAARIDQPHIRKLYFCNFH